MKKTDHEQDRKFYKIPDKEKTLWRKLSLALWKDQASAFRSCEVKIKIPDEVIVKVKESKSGWLSFWIYIITQVIKENRRFNYFVLKNDIYTRENVDFLIRMSHLSDEQGGLWGMYLRGCENDDSSLSIKRRIIEFKNKFVTKEKRLHDYKILERIIVKTPVFLLRLVVSLCGLCLRQNYPVPILSNLCYPTVSFSNLGSIDAPLLPQIQTPLLISPIQISLGRLEDNSNSFTLFLGMDHRLHDGDDVSLFIKEINKQIISHSTDSRPQTLDPK